MTLVQASDAARLAGLTSHQLREWCGRRALVVPDVPAAGRGRLALFSWQTILALRVLNELHERYGVEVCGWRIAIAQLQAVLKGRSFPSLWGAFAVFPNAHEAVLKLQGELLAQDSCLTVSLNRHLEALATPSELLVEAQLPLFPALAVRR
ncbi:MAG: MerR family transcriptional regulator [Phenylobacterium sp.]|uniref:MerR family transcriptional regulator n=1 Tax=Phenylobacterium sp. TaxID=1871053 RepID=UPI001B787772|nr:MerR family transcriptional regulator [Phenylobacterium sp.]MBP8947197.1 MerR family transcriptional regulator [Promineifilum sp.]